jgi:branched-chain amino acid transport system permease protein
MKLLLQQVINGFAVGSTYAMFAMSFGLIFATMNILNVAHGVYATWGAIIAWYAVTSGVSFYQGLAVGVIGAGCLGVLIDQVAFQPLRNREGGQLGPIITSIGAWIVMLQLALIVTDAQIHSFPRKVLPLHTYRFWGIILPMRQLISIGASVIVFLLLYFFLQRTKVGAAMRAVGANQESASLSGVNARTMIIMTSFLAGSIAGLTGVISAMSTNNVSFTLGEGLLLKGFAAVIVGGFGDVRGAMLGGFIVGLSEVLGGQYVSNTFRDAFAFGLLLLVLIIRPKGLLGTREVRLRA